MIGAHAGPWDAVVEKAVAKVTASWSWILALPWFLLAVNNLGQLSFPLSFLFLIGKINIRNAQGHHENRTSMSALLPLPHAVGIQKMQMLLLQSHRVGVSKDLGSPKSLLKCRFPGLVTIQPFNKYFSRLYSTVPGAGILPRNRTVALPSYTDLLFGGDGH